MIVHRNRLKLCFEPPVQQDTYQCQQNYGEIINSDVGAGRTDATVERSRTLNSGEGDNSFTLMKWKTCQLKIQLGLGPGRTVVHRNGLDPLSNIELFVRTQT